MRFAVSQTATQRGRFPRAVAAGAPHCGHAYPPQLCQHYGDNTRYFQPQWVPSYSPVVLFDEGNSEAEPRDRSGYRLCVPDLASGRGKRANSRCRVRLRTKRLARVQETVMTYHLEEALGPEDRDTINNYPYMHGIK